MDLTSSRRYAADMANVYWKSAKAHSHAKTALATALPVVNVGALYNAQTHPDPGNDFLAVAGYGSALGLTLGSLLISPERQRIYLAGQAAALCALHRTDGYVIDAKFDRYLEFGGGDLGKALYDARAAQFDATALRAELVQRKRQSLADAKAIDDSVKTKKLGKDARRQAEARSKDLKAAAENDALAQQDLDLALARANSAIDATTATRQGLSQFASRSQNAGKALRADIDGIRNAVDVQVLRTEPDVKQIRASLSATALASVRAGDSEPSLKAQGRRGVLSASKVESALGSRGLEVLSRLERVTRDLVLLREPAEEALAMLLAGENKGALNTNCTVSNINGLVVYPPSQALVAGGEVLAVLVRAPAPPKATIEGADTGISVVEVVVTAEPEYKVRLKADATATTGDRNLVVSIDGERQSVPFKVEAAKVEPAPPPPPPTEGETSPDNETERPPGAVSNGQ